MGCDIHENFEVKNEEGKWERLATRHEELCKQLYGPDSEENDEKTTSEQRDKMWQEMWDHPLNLGRNYDLFAILADVRNGRGFAGIKTGDGFEPISEPRGMPDDISQSVMDANGTGHDPNNESYEDWVTQAKSWVAQGYSTVLQEEPLIVSSPDWHSHSWYTLKELLDYDWHAKTTTRRGMVDQAAYATWNRDNPGFPDNLCAGISGTFIKVLKEEEMQERIKNGLPAEEKVTRNIKDEDVEGDQQFYCEVNFELRYGDCCGSFVDNTLPFLKKHADEHLDGDYEKLRFVFWFDN